MNFSCSICCNGFEPSDNKISSTKCGHVFHFPCLSDWLQRSATCPECRKPTLSTEILRLYLNISNNDGKRDDLTALQERIKNLKFDKPTREIDVKYFNEMTEKLYKREAEFKELSAKLAEISIEKMEESQYKRYF